MKKTKSFSKNKKNTPQSSFLFYLFAGFLILLIPVFHWPQALDITLMPRTLALSAFLFIIALFFFKKMQLPNYGYAMFRHALFPVLLAFLAVTIIAIVFSFNYKEGFFDLVKTSLFICAIAFASLIFAQTDEWQEKLPKFVVVSAIIAIIVGSAQYITEVVMVEAKYIRADLPTIYNVKGLMSHKNEFSNSLMLMLPFLAYGVYGFKKGWKNAAIVALVMVLVMIFLLKTRAVWLGILFSLFVTSLVMVIYHKKLSVSTKWRNAIGLSIIIGITGLAVIFILPAPTDAFSPLGRIKSMTDLNLLHNVHRLHIWKGTIEMIKDNPITGVGPGNWRILFQPYVAGDFSRFTEINWVRPHNDFLWIFVEKGIFGFMLFMSFFSMLFYYLWKILVQCNDPKKRMLALFLFAGIISYLIISFFSFPSERINHQVYLALMAASTMALYNQIKPQKALKINKFVMIVPAMAMLLFGVVYGYSAVKQESHIQKAMLAEKQGKYKESIHYAEMSKNPFRDIDPLSNPADYYIAQSHAGMNDYDKAIVSIDKALEKFPDNVTLIHWKAVYYFQKKDYKEAEKYFSLALTYMPKSKDILSNLATTYFYLGRHRKALQRLNQIPRPEQDEKVRFLKEELKKIIENEKDK